MANKITVPGRVTRVSELKVGTLFRYINGSDPTNVYMRCDLGIVLLRTGTYYTANTYSDTEVAMLRSCTIESE